VAEGAPLAKGSAPGDVPKLYYYPPAGAGVSYPAAGAAVGSAVIVLPAVDTNTWKRTRKAR